MSKNLLKILIKEILKEALEENPKNKLVVMDFDDTIAKTDGKIHVVDKETKEKLFDLDPAEYAVYDKELAKMLNQDFDYSDFQKVINPKAIEWTQDILKNAIKQYGINHVLILTARGPTAEPEIREYLIEQGIDPKIPIIALGDSDPQQKANYLIRFAMQFGFDEIEFYDDSPKNIKAAEKANEWLKKQGYNTKLKNVHVKHH